MFTTLLSHIGWMSQLENESSEPLANVDALAAAAEDETDEFEVIHGENDDDQARESDLDGKVLYVERSAPVSECGPDVADVGDGLDAGNSSSSVRSHNLFDSVYSFQPPFADNSNIEKLLRDGQEKHQLILQQLVNMVSDLSKEKNEVIEETSIGLANSELREKFAKEQGENVELREKYERLLSMHDKAKVLTQKINANFLEATGSLNTAQKKIKELKEEKAHVNVQHQEEIQRLKVDNRKIVAKNEHLAEQNRQLNERMNTLATEGVAAVSCRDEQGEAGGILEARRLMDDASVHNLQLMEQNRILNRQVAQLSLANQQEESRIAVELTMANQQLAMYEVELDNHREIIKVLQEENAELLRAMEQSRQKYRRNIDSLEEQVASYRDRGEVNFA